MIPIGVDGNDIHLIIQSVHGPLYHQTLALAAITAQMTDGEVLRYTFDVVDPEEGTTHSGAARIMIEMIPDPRQAPPSDPGGLMEAFIKRTGETA